MSAHTPEPAVCLTCFGTGTFPGFARGTFPCPDCVKITETNVSHTIDRDAEPIEPLPAEVAGFELCAWKVKGGGIQLGADKGFGRKMPDFPSTVRVCGMVYTLEVVRWQANGFGWGSYV